MIFPSRQPTFSTKAAIGNGITKIGFNANSFWLKQLNCCCSLSSCNWERTFVAPRTSSSARYGVMSNPGSGRSILNLVLSSGNKADLAPFLVYCLWTAGSPLNNWNSGMYEWFLRYLVEVSALTMSFSWKKSGNWLSSTIVFHHRIRLRWRCFCTTMKILACSFICSTRNNKVHRDPGI